MSVRILNLKYRLNFKVGFAKPLVIQGEQEGNVLPILCPALPITYDECHESNAIVNLFSLSGPAKASVVLGKTKAGSSPTKEPVQD